MKKKIVITAIIVILIIALAIGIFIVKEKNRNNEEELKTIAVSEVTRSVFYAPQYVAISQGFFE